MDKQIKDTSYNMDSINDNYNFFGVKDLYSLINTTSDRK